MAIRDFGSGTMSIAVIFACLVCVTYAQQSANSAGYRLEPEP